MRGLASVAFCLALVACAGDSPEQSDWELAHEAQSWRESRVTLPPYPKSANLVEFDVGTDSDFHFLVDTASLSVGSDGVVRYVLVARSSEGADNVSFEGLHCRNGEFKIYATGREDGTWIGAREPRWRPVEQRAGSWHKALAHDYLCPNGDPIRTVGEGVAALRRGGNPRARELLQGD
ncbi:MAG TPA: CNP1-like family protein [Burkholderiales bacterium]|nr:CNP1-like family protein [Burkholderiales bacterium]